MAEGEVDTKILFVCGELDQSIAISLKKASTLGLREELNGVLGSGRRSLKGWGNGMRRKRRGSLTLAATRRTVRRRR